MARSLGASAHLWAAPTGANGEELGGKRASKGAWVLAPSKERGRRRELFEGGVREVVEVWGDVLVGAGRAGRQVQARMLARRRFGRWGRRGRAHLPPEEMRAVVEAASPM